jgi:predicted transcriptional regulator
MDYAEGVAATIRAEAVAAGYGTAKEFAPVAHIPYGTLLRYWDGDREPRSGALAKIATGLGLKVSEFYALVEGRMDRAASFDEQWRSRGTDGHPPE